MFVLLSIVFHIKIHFVSETYINQYLLYAKYNFDNLFKAILTPNLQFVIEHCKRSNLHINCISFSYFLYIFKNFMATQTVEKLTNCSTNLRCQLGNTSFSQLGKFFFKNPYINFVIVLFKYLSKPTLFLDFITRK